MKSLACSLMMMMAESRLRLRSFATPRHGTVVLNPDGSLRYMPAADFSGEDSFTYRAAGEGIESDQADVTITVRAVNDAPVAVDDAYVVAAGETLNSSASVILSDNPSGYWRLDDAEGSQQAVDSSGNDHHGTYVGDVELEQLGAVSAASEKAIRLDRSTDRVSLPNVVLDGMADLSVEFWFNTNDDNTHVIVSASGPGDRGFFDDNELLIFIHDENRVSMTTGADVNRSVWREWTLPSIADGQWHHYMFVRNDTEDFLELFVDGQSRGRRAAELTPITVAPGGLIIGEDQDVLGGAFQSSQALNGRLDELAIFPVAFSAEDAARHFRAGQPMGLLDNDLDIDDDTLTARIVGGADNGVVVLSDDGSFTYTPLANFVGVDRFHYRSSDGQEESNLATVTIRVGDQAEAIVAIDDSYSATVGEPLNVSGSPLVGILDNDNEPAANALRALLVDPPSTGELVLATDGTFTFTPGPGFSGEESFTYRATNETLVSNLATVTITVEPAASADLTRDGRVDFDDLTILLANWNQNVNQAGGNIVDRDTTPVNFDDLTAMLAAWTVPDADPSPGRAPYTHAATRHVDAVFEQVGASERLRSGVQPGSAGVFDSSDGHEDSPSQRRLRRLAASRRRL